MTVEGQVDVTNSSAGTGGAINAQGKLHGGVWFPNAF